jgi:hypothetical protein
MAFEQVEYKFPDEQEAPPKEETNESEEFKVEVVDDTPPEDRNRTPLPKKIVEELDGDDLEEYSEKVKKRLGQMKKVWHDERRAKDAATREKEEALRFAQQQYEENKQLKQRLGRGEQAYVKMSSDAATNELATAKDKLRQAYEAGDAGQITEAQELLTDAKLKLREVQRYRPALQSEENQVQATQQVQAPARTPAQHDSRAETWRQENTWFGANKSMTALALGLHEEMVESGVNPRSDEYYDKLNRTMRKRFPEAFEDETEQTTRDEKPVRTKAANVVAPATRSTAPRQVRLTPSQVAIAKKLGLSNEQYAKEVMKLEANQNG